MLIKRQVINKNLKTKLIFIFSVVFLYILIVAIVFGYGSYRNLLKDKSLTYSKRNAESLTVLLDERIENLNSFARTILYDERVYGFNRDIILSEQDPVFQYKFGLDVDNYLRSILVTHDEFMSVAFQFKSKTIPFISSRIYTMNPQIVEDMEKLLKEGRKGKGKPVWYASTGSNGKQNIYLLKVAYDMNTLSEIGMYVFKINPSSLFDVLGKLNQKMEHNIYVFDSYQKLLYQYTHFEPITDNFNQKISRLDSTDEFAKIKTKNDIIYTNTNNISKGAFKLVLCLSSQALLKEVNNQAKVLFLLFLLIIPILGVLVNYFFVDIMKPMNLLVRKMKNIEKGDIGVTIDQQRNDEFGYVFKTFNKMSLQIKVLIDSVYKEQLALKDEEIKALQSQINPHFLYNTLEAINFKARINKVPEISDMVSALSYIMEANMNRNNERFVTIAKEIEYIENYRFIIEKRFNDKLRFSLHVNEELMKCQVPKLIILPIIENSVYHGLEMKKGEGLIELMIDKKENNIIMTVKDNGLGIEPDQLKKINNYMDIDIDDIDECERKSVSNIGLINVHKRLKLLYGNQYGLELESIVNEGTTVWIKMPYMI